ncbi:ATP-binding cassette domain-containing protein [Octadecabacter ascidiaceicola]|uniref:Toxin RTX-I translocation ATP-binding protein n=1 Tax=Octadecabacter ascidiaceicola TaxID=1655543 RepID=A0A238K5A9_9RHOB|nr:ATP-binding cassette domain-containing protein [Octadecabacter ascidiaceicola]SMX38088.1 Toxin RTX-I translocation ATP-binding protein [Octadecabacter ascidiaceicola]
MTGPVIAFDINATSGGKLTRISKAEPKEAANTQDAIDETHPASAEDRFSDKAKTRADLAATYAGLLGVDIVRSDLLEVMTAASGDDITPHAIAKALNEAGLVSEVTTVGKPTADQWPALVEMTSGHVLLVLDQTDDAVIVFDTTCRDNRAEVPINEFIPFFSGLVLRADMAIADLSKKHARKGKKAHWFWGEMMQFRRHIAEVALGSFVANLLAVAVALFSLQVYDRVIPHQSTATLWVLAIGAGLAMLLEAGLRIARARLMDGAGRKIELQVQSLLMDRLLGMRRGKEGQTPSGLFSAVREFGSVREFFTASTIGTLTDLPFIVLFLALVASIGGNVVWVLFVGGLLMVLPSFFLQKKMIALTHQTQGASAKSNKLLHEVIYEADTIKSQRGEDRFKRLWAELSAVSSLATSEQRKLASTLTFWAQGVQQATYVAAVVAGTFMVFTGEFTVGTIIAVGILTSRTLGPLTQLAATLARWSNVKAALEALGEIAEAEQDQEEDRTYLRREEMKGAFELRDIAFCYNEDSGQNLDIPGLKIEAGQRIAVLGSNGSGKSTMLKLLSGIYRPTKGRVLIDGVDMGQVMPRDLRRSIGYLSQEVRLFSGTLRENLNLTLLERDDDRLLASLDFAGLGPFVRNHPKGLDLEISDGGEGLSVGQRQSIGWARLWLQDPKVCLLDEPTAALDQTLEATIVSRLDTWLEGRTAIIATHRVPILELTTRTVILQNGRLAVDGPRQEVLAHLQKNNKKATA